MSNSFRYWIETRTKLNELRQDPDTLKKFFPNEELQNKLLELLKSHIHNTVLYAIALNRAQPSYATELLDREKEFIIDEFIRYRPMKKYEEEFLKYFWEKERLLVYEECLNRGESISKYDEFFGGGRNTFEYLRAFNI
jgi:hypothetical protein